MPEIIDLYTGDVKVSQGNSLLITKAIASCVAIAVFDSFLRVGGMAHVMLPGKAPKSYDYEESRFAQNAIDSLVGQMEDKGCKTENMETIVVGGGNVLRREQDSVGMDNLQSVKDILQDKKIKIVAEESGGYERRGLKLEVWSGKLYLSTGDDHFRPWVEFSTNKN